MKRLYWSTYPRQYPPYYNSLTILLNSWAALTKLCGRIHKNPDGKNPGFGAWGNEAFTAVEMRGLYSVLNSSVLLFGETLVNSTVKEQCSKEPVEEKCGFLAHMKAAVFTPNQTAFTALLNNKLCPNAQRCFKRF